MTTKRKGLSKSIRFEVFKRDSFTCQYCGRAAPDVILEVDHIQPVSKDGENEITNLITSCKDCNAGKSDRELSDDTVIQKRKKQLDELQERREQLDMILEWQRGLVGLEDESVEKCSEFWADLVTGWSLNEHGLSELKRHIRKYGISEVLEVMRISTDQYLKWETSDDGVDKPTEDSVSKAWEYVGRICSARKAQKDKPYMRDLFYLRGIMKNRYAFVNQWEAIKILENGYDKGISVDDLKAIVLSARNYTEWRAMTNDRIALEE